MRTLIMSSLVSVDGIHGDPQSWVGDLFDDQAAEESLAVLLDSDAMLMGRNTYEYFAPAFSSASGPYLERINAMRKYVFSSTLTAADWNNTTIIPSDPVAAVQELKEQGDRQLVIYGYGQLAQTLLEHGLVEQAELRHQPAHGGQRDHAVPPRQAHEAAAGLRHRAPQWRGHRLIRQRLKDGKRNRQGALTGANLV